MAAQGPATPSALYKMISIPEAQELVLSETQPLPSVSVDLAEAVGSVLAENVQAPENVPPFPASIKVRSTSQPFELSHMPASTDLSCRPFVAKQPASTALHLLQDGYAVVSADGPGEYIVAFAAHAGHQQPRLQSGSVAYITTGD